MFDWRKHAPNALTHIRIGPAADLKERGKFVSDLLMRNLETPTQVHIDKSETTFRGQCEALAVADP